MSARPPSDDSEMSRPTLRPSEDPEASLPPLPSSKEPQPPLDIDAVISEIGGFGRYQIRTFLLILPPILCCAVYMTQYIFVAAQVQHRCLVPECEAPGSGWAVGSWAAWALPPGASCERYRPAPGSTSCTANDFTKDKQKCDRRIYEHYDISIVSTFDLGCTEWRRTMVGTVHSAGLLLALPITGYFSDKFGRRTAFVCTASAVGLAGLARSFATSYIVYLVFEFLDSAIGSGVYTCGFILVMELLGNRWRVFGGNIISCVFAVGQMACALAAWALPQWRLLTRVLYAPSLLFIGYALVLPESVRWLLARGRVADAARIVFRAADYNKVKLSPAAVAQLTRPDGVEGTSQDDDAPPKALCKEIVKSHIMMTRLTVCSFWWVTTTLVYYGLSINAVSLAGEPHLNFALSSLVELPGYALSVMTLDRFGRKRSIITAFSICGLALVSLPFIPTKYPWMSTSLSMVGKLCISMAFSSIYIYTSELFPTAARHRLLGACSMVGRIGNLLAPQTPLLTAVAAWMPYAVFGGMALCSALLMMTAPETLHRQLPDTIEQAEALKRTPRAEPTT